MLLDIYSYARIKPAANQIELHPYLVQSDLVALHEKLGIKLIAYSPLSALGWDLRDEKLKGKNIFKEPIIT